MARVPQITRTIVTTKCTVLGMDLTDKEVVNKEVILPRTYKDKKHLLKAVANAVDTETFKSVDVVDTEIVETLYGMSEQKFIETAEILPPRK